MSTLTPYMFSDTATPEPPNNSDIRFIEEMSEVKYPTYYQASKLARLMYGPFGYGTTYKCAGWLWYLDLIPHLRTYLVCMTDRTIRKMLAGRVDALRDMLGGDALWISRMDIVWIRGAEPRDYDEDEECES